MLGLTELTSQNIHRFADVARNARSKFIEIGWEPEFVLIGTRTVVSALVKAIATHSRVAEPIADSWNFRAARKAI